MQTVPKPTPTADDLPATGSDEDMKRFLKARFPAWNIIRSDKGRWWAFRVPPRDDLDRVSDVDAETAAGLYLKLVDL